MGRAVALAFVVALVPHGCGSHTAGQARVAPPGKPVPPVIHERFTLLPCPRGADAQTTLGIEGCAEHEIVRRDRAIEATVQAIFPLLGDDDARRRLVAAESAWLVYRQASCDSESDLMERGTGAGLVAATCTADRDAAHLRDLRAFERDLTSG